MSLVLHSKTERLNYLTDRSSLAERGTEKENFEGKMVLGEKENRDWFCEWSEFCDRDS